MCHALLAEAKRALGDLAGAELAISRGVAVDENDPHVRHERAVVFVAAGNPLGAQVEWQKLLASHPLHLDAFVGLGQLALQRGDLPLAQSVVDHALALHAQAPPEMLRRAIHLVMQVEPASVARGARLEALCQAVTRREPRDGVAELIHARALAEMGDMEGAVRKLDALEHTAKGSPVATEAARVRLQVREPLAAAFIDATMRAACETDGHDVATLDTIATRARRLGDLHQSWVAHLAAAIAERRLGRFERAKEDAVRARGLAEGAPIVHLELAMIELGRKMPGEAAEHARKAIELEPALPRAREILTQALAAEAHAHEAQRASWIDRLLRR
jgi:tetratricopeptide (TPR) repeat protein